LIIQQCEPVTLKSQANKSSLGGNQIIALPNPTTPESNFNLQGSWLARVASMLLAVVGIVAFEGF
jgi:hypothetical protein